MMLNMAPDTPTSARAEQICGHVRNRLAAAESELMGQGNDESVEPGFGGVVRRCRVVAGYICRPRADDPAAPMVDHVVDGGTGYPPRTREVNVDHAASQVGIGCERRASRSIETGDLHHSVDTSQRIYGRCDHRIA